MENLKTKENDPDMSRWAAGFRRRAAEKRIPLTAMLELTSRCNLRCQHCYLGDQEAQHAKREQERNTEQVKASLQEWADAGCLYLTITGGDPMMREDFPEIYRTACELGMLVTVFCDGILVDEAMIELFKEFPPLKVEISIYGATRGTYELVTQVPRSHAEAWQGIDRLCANGIRVGLKTVVMTLNEHEVPEMEAQAEQRGLSFRFDSAIFPCLPVDSNEPIDLRVPPETAVKHDLAGPGRLQKWAANIETAGTRPQNDSLYQCGAGLTSFYADPYGKLSPCLMTRNYVYSQDGRAFEDVWHIELSEIRKKKRTRKDDSLCGGIQGACTHCPAMNYVETGDEETVSDYMKETARLRYETVISEIKKEETS